MQFAIKPMTGFMKMNGDWFYGAMIIKKYAIIHIQEDFIFLIIYH